MKPSKPDVARSAALADEDLEEVLAGLGRTPRELPCRLLYDARGSELFEEICELPEYYPTRTELGIYRDHLAEMARELGPECLVIEPGSGSGIKTRMLLEALERPAGCVPIEISVAALGAGTKALHEAFPALPVVPVRADFARLESLPARVPKARRRVVFFPGSTIGNFHPDDAVSLLRRFAALTGDDGAILVGADLRKAPDVLERAYDDARGVTAEFNRNLLVRLNRELGADFAVERFDHRAAWVDVPGRMEMHLVSRTAQTVHVAGRAFAIGDGEHIRTECSYKFTIDGFRAIAGRAGLSFVRAWTDPQDLFSVQLYRVGEVRADLRSRKPRA